MIEAANRLARILESVPPRLSNISDADAAHRTAPGRWSKKEILGHLIDSAGNNHQRFVRAQFVPVLAFPNYEQEGWVAAQSYATESWPDLAKNGWLKTAKNGSAKNGWLKTANNGSAKNGSAKNGSA